MRTFFRRRRFWVLLAVLGTAIGMGLSLFAPRSHTLRTFDPDEVARLETAMWRSYYAKDHAALVHQGAELLRSQNHMPYGLSYVVAGHAGRAAFVFKKGRDREDYEKALPHLVELYETVRQGADIDFDPQEVAKLELEWWIVHRERKRAEPGDLARAVAECTAALYQVPVEEVEEHARLRAEAMTIRDESAAAGGVSGEDWAAIEQLLREAWGSLYAVVKPD